MTWYEGRSPANFYLTKNIMENGSISFPKGYLIGDIPVENFFDFFEIDGKFYPKFNFLGNYPYATILCIFSPSTNLQLFKGMITINIIFSAITLLIFYHIQRLLGLNIKYALTSSLIAGIAASVLIYSRHLFINHILMNLIFVSSIYILLKYRKKITLKTEIFATLIFSLFLALGRFYQAFLYFIVLSYFFVKYKFIRSVKVLIIPVLIIILMYIFFYFSYSGTPSEYPRSAENIISTEVVHLHEYVPTLFKGIPIIKIFSKYINALDYVIFGYHDPTSVWKLYRGFAYIYAFEEPKGNAIFLTSYGLFGSLFGPRGIIFNSPYLIFSILGIFAFKMKNERNLLLSITILIIITYGLLHLMWCGGVTPRYNRYLTIPVLFLTFFSFYYIQKTKNTLAKLIFIILVVLSVLNVTSLAIRTDWTYEHQADLVSYDLVLWPWYPLPEEMMNVTNETTILLTSKEIPNWKLSGEGPCKATFGGMGLVTDTCYCAYDSWAERKIGLEKDIETIEVKSCSAIAGNDGTKGLIYIDNELIGEIFIESDSCATKTFSVSISSDIYTIKLKSGKYGECSNEMVFWKSIKFE